MPGQANHLGNLCGAQPPVPEHPSGKRAWQQQFRREHIRLGLTSLSRRIIIHAAETSGNGVVVCVKVVRLAVAVALVKLIVRVLMRGMRGLHVSWQTLVDPDLRDLSVEHGFGTVQECVPVRPRRYPYLRTLGQSGQDITRPNRLVGRKSEIPTLRNGLPSNVVFPRHRLPPPKQIAWP
nr:hypothetical protein [Capsulimonas corticalis]